MENWKGKFQMNEKIFTLIMVNHWILWTFSDDSKSDKSKTYIVT